MKTILFSVSKYTSILAIVFSLVMPFFLVSANNHVGAPGSGIGAPSSGTGAPGSGIGAPSNTGVSIDAKIKNPLANGIDDLPSLIEAILNIILTIGVPIVTLAIIYSGFLFVKAQGNSEELKTAKQALVYTLVGAALLLGSFVLSQAIKGTVDDITSTT